MQEKEGPPPEIAEAPADPEWPSHFPADCPPQDAVDLSGSVYLLVATNPPTATDMECAIDRGSFLNSPQCQRASLSCARTPEHLYELRRGVKRLRNHLVAGGQFQSAHGKIKQTGAPGHYSMWLRAKYLQMGHTLFKVIP